MSKKNNIENLVNLEVVFDVEVEVEVENNNNLYHVIKYSWCWTDEEDTYINISNSLEEIVTTVLNYYFNWDDEDDDYEELDKIIRVNTNSDIMSIHIRSSDGEVSSYEISATEYSVCEFLEKIARELERPDLFAIQGI